MILIKVFKYIRKIKEFKNWLLSKITFSKYDNQDEKSLLTNPKTVQNIQKNITALQHKISKKLKKGKKIKVCFVIYEKAQWTMQSIYDAFKKDNLFEPFVFVCDAWERKHEKGNPKAALIDFCKQKGMSVITEFDNKCMPDIVFTQFFDFERIHFPLSLIENIKNILFCYIPYSWILTNSDNYFYKNNICNLFWKYYVYTERDYEVAKTGFANGKNVVVSGAPNNDIAYNTKITHNIWKTKNTIKIIYAPHWSLYKTCNATATFDRYYKKIFEYLRQHKEIEMIYKPHPFLNRFISDKELQKQYGVDLDFITADEYSKYVEIWKDLPNGSVMDDGDYYELFASSDAMILDSVSFIAEYSLFNKPSCFLSICDNLETLKTKFNEIGHDFLSSMMIAYNWTDIEKFMEDVVISGEDCNAEKRKQMQDKYFTLNKGRVGEFIKDDVKRSLLI